ncbi:MAG TPA: GNAT family protein, partial [Propionibacteriaceae bacterium]|nr:GNAT family protein [Propionibacteriaceae bacterium]
GRTERGLLVELVEYDEARAVAAPSEFDEFPDGPAIVPLGLGRLLVEVTDEDGLRAVAGAVSWHEVHYGPSQGCRAWNMGIGLAPAARGHGVGSVAQRLLAEWLLRTTDVDRIEASTDVTNVPEQRALERAGFTREGILRSAQERVDGRHDLYSYSLLRTDVGVPRPSS